MLMHRLMEQAASGEQGGAAGGTANETTATTAPAVTPAPAAPEPNQQDAGATQKAAVDGKQEQEQPQGAPEQYDLKVPEGAIADKFVVDQLSALARANNWTNEQAQAVLDASEKQNGEIKAARERAWVTEWHSDPALGGVNIQKTLVNIERVTTAMPDLAALLKSTGFLNNPVVVKRLAQIGASMAEDKPQAAAQGTQAPASGPQRTLAERMYPSMKKP